MQWGGEGVHDSQWTTSKQRRQGRGRTSEDEDE